MMTPLETAATALLDIVSDAEADELFAAPVAAAIKRLRAAMLPPAPAPETWTHLADENKLFPIAGPRKVRYGAPPDAWIYKTITAPGEYPATNDFFGGDPIVGTLKTVQISNLAPDGSPVPAPPPPSPAPPAPGPAPTPPSPPPTVASLRDIPPGVIVELPTYTHGPYSEKRVDFSCLALNPMTGELEIFGQGHGTTPLNQTYSDMIAFNPRAMSWRSITHRMTQQEYAENIADETLFGRYEPIGIPLPQHTYNMHVVVGTRSYLLGISPGPIVWHEHDRSKWPAGATHGWGYSSIVHDRLTGNPYTPDWYYASAACVDPKRPTHIIISGSKGQSGWKTVWDYDTVADTYIEMPRVGVTPGNEMPWGHEMVSIPAADKFRCVGAEGDIHDVMMTRHGDGSVSCEIVPVRVNAPKWEVAGSGRNASGWAFDGTNIIGNVVRGKVHVLPPNGTEVSLVQLRNPDGTPSDVSQVFHCFERDPDSGACVFLSDGRAWAFRLDGAPAPAPVPVPPPPPAPPPPAPAPEPAPPAPAGKMAAPDHTGTSTPALGPPDYVAPEDILPPTPWTTFVDDKLTIAHPMGGVEPVAHRRLSVFGIPNVLYRGTPLMVADRIEQLSPWFGEDPATILQRLAAYPLRGGPRERNVLSSYAMTWGHDRRRLDGTLATDMSVPYAISLVMNGEMPFLFRDGSVTIPIKLPVQSYANDFSYHSPRELNVFYWVETGLGEVWETNRHTLVHRFVGKVPGRATSVRSVDGLLYVPAPDDGAVYEMNPLTGDKRRVCRMELPFFVDFFSNGDLSVMTNQSMLHRVTRDGAVGPDLLNNRKDSSWVQCAVDRPGTCGQTNTIGVARMFGAQNTDVFRVRENGVVGGFRGGLGVAGVGDSTYCQDEAGHYPWFITPHPNDANWIIGGAAQAQPIIMAASATALNDEYNHDLMGKAWRVLEDTTRGPSLMALINKQGGSQLCSADGIALMPFADQVAFVRRGMVGSYPCLLSDDDMRALLYLFNRNSQRYLAEGPTHIERMHASLTSSLQHE